MFTARGSPVGHRPDASGLQDWFADGAGNDGDGGLTTTRAARAT